MVCSKRVESIFEDPDQEQVRKAKDQLGEDDARMGHAEAALAQWMELQPHLPNVYEKNMVRNFLRGAKHDVEKTKKKLESYFCGKAAYPEFYCNRDPTCDQILRALDSINMVFMPKLTENGERVSVFSIADPDAAAFDMEAYAKLVLMIYDLLMMAESPVSGEILIFDTGNVSPSHVLKLLVPSFKNLIAVLRSSYTVRVKEIHVVNAPTIMEKILGATKSFCHEKVRKRFVVHKGVESLLKYVPRELLPADLGGDQDGLRSLMGRWHEVLKNNADWFREQEEIKVVGTAPKKTQQFQNHLGVEGSFRKLSID